MTDIIHCSVCVVLVVGANEAPEAVSRMFGFIFLSIVSCGEPFLIDVVCRNSPETHTILKYMSLYVCFEFRNHWRDVVKCVCVCVQFKSSGKTPGYISLSEFTAWMMAGLM